MSINNSAVPSSNNIFENDLSFEQILTFVGRHIFLVAGLAVLGAIVGICGTLVFPSEWEAETVLQMGQISRSNGAVPQVTQIEKPEDAVTRLNLESVKHDILRELGLPIARHQDRSTDIFLNYSSASLVKNSELIVISARGYSVDQARSFVDKYTAHLIKDDNELLKPAITLSLSDVEQTQASLASLQQRRNDLEVRLLKNSGDIGGEKFSENVLLNVLLHSMATDSDSLQQHLLMVRDDLGGLRTFNTRALSSEITFSDRPVFPKKSVFTGMGILIGLVVGLGLGALRDRRKSKDFLPSGN